MKDDSLVSGVNFFITNSIFDGKYYFQSDNIIPNYIGLRFFEIVRTENLKALIISFIANLSAAMEKN